MAHWGACEVYLGVFDALATLQVVGIRNDAAESHAIALEVNHQLQHHLQFLSAAIVHVDPASAAGEIAHAVESHSHDGLGAHTH